MEEHARLAEQFEAHRTHLRTVAYRMLGSMSEAEDAVQESWLHLSRADISGVENLGGWLTTVVARICLDMLRSRKARREEFLEEEPELLEESAESVNPEEEVLLSDAVGAALLVVLDNLNPSERLAFVLHDIFAVPFDVIAPIVERTPTATRQLASRARRRVQGTPVLPEVDIRRQSEVVNAFLAASRAGDFNALLGLLAPDVVFRHDRAMLAAGEPEVISGAQAVAGQFSGRAHGAHAALVNGAVGAIVTWQGKLALALNLTFADGKIAEINVVAEPERLKHLDLAILGNR